MIVFYLTELYILDFCREISTLKPTHFIKIEIIKNSAYRYRHIRES